MNKHKEAFKRVFDKELAEQHITATNKVKNDLLERLRRATPVDTGHARDSWKMTENGIINDAEYISDLNNGSSKQAPPFFVEKEILATPGVKIQGALVRTT
jgi:hypothetical protein